jgi:hypothetical protein
MSIRTHPLGNKVIKNSLKFSLSEAEQSAYVNMYEEYNKIHHEIACVENRVHGANGNQKKIHFVMEVL